MRLGGHTRTRPGGIDPIWWSPVLVVVIAALSAMTALLFSGALRGYVPLTLVSDRAGLVMENGAKVKLRGIQVGEVRSLGAQAGPDSSQKSMLILKMYPRTFEYLPSNVEAEIKSSTAFGAKYVELIVPAEGPRTLLNNPAWLRLVVGGAWDPW